MSPKFVEAEVPVAKEDVIEGLLIAYTLMELDLVSGGTMLSMLASDSSDGKATLVGTVEKLVILNNILCKKKIILKFCSIGITV